MSQVTWTSKEGGQNPLVSLTSRLFKVLNIPATRSYIKKNLLIHPDYPSLLSLSESLKIMGLNNQALKISTDLLHEAGFPSLAHMNSNEFVMVEAIKDGRVHTRNASGRRANSSLETFSSLWSGILLMLQPEEQPGETDYRQNRRREIFNTLRHLCNLFFAPLFLSVVYLLKTLSSPPSGLIPPLFALTHIIGLIPCLFILSSTLGGLDFLSHLCPHGKKMNCSSVIHSPAGKILGISLAEAGLVYFMGGFITILLTLFTGNTSDNLLFLAILSLLSLPYTLYLIIYQSFVLRKWCWMCLFMQTLFWTDFFVLRNFWLDKTAIIPDLPMELAAAFILAMFFCMLLRQIISHSNNSEQLLSELTKIRRNPEYIKIKIAESAPEDMGAFTHDVEIGPENAPNSLTLLISPSCVHCRTVYLQLSRLISISDDQVKGVIRFLADTEKTAKSKIRTQADFEVSTRIIALSVSGQRQLVQQALYDWFSYNGKINGEKLARWLEKYPAPDAPDNDSAQTMVTAYREWAYSHNFHFTPTIFLNGTFISPEITLEDLMIYLMRTE